MNVKQLYRTIRDLFSETKWVKLTYEIFNLEKNFNYSDFEKSAKLCREELKNSKVKNVEIIELKADGKTVYGDFIMPESFDWEYAYLKITHPIEFKDYILADTKIHPFCIANRSAPTKEKLFEIIHINDINKKKNLKNYLVFCDNIHPSICRESIESTNAEGIISSYSGAPEYKDCMYWINGWSRRSGWYQTKDEKKLICFSISPSKGELLKKLIEKGSVKVCACVKSKIYNGKINLITGNIPGKRKKEITFLAHLYEPMINDNASGVSGLIEVANLINTMIENYGFTPEYGIRFLFGMEMYGFENFFEKKHSIIYGINVDCITCDIQKTGTKYITVYESHFTNPFFGDWIFEDLLERFFCFPWRKRRTPYHDNTFISDLSIGIPVLYIISSPGKFHHNSYDSEIVNWAQGKEILFLLTTYCCLLSSGKLSNYLEQIEFWAKKEFFSYLCKLQNLNETTKYHLENRVLFFSEYLKKKYCSLELFDVKPCRKFLKEIDEISEKTLKKLKKQNLREKLQKTREDKKAENIIITKRKPVFIFSLANIPYKEKIPIPEEINYIVNRIDGKKDLSKIFQEISFEREIFNLPPLNENEKKELRKYIEYLSKYNYLEQKFKTILTKEDIKRDLQKLGIKKGDKIIVHSSLSSIGYVIGGAKTVCESIMEVIKEEGVLIMPSFNHGLIFKDKISTYFSPVETPTINGSIPDTFWKMKGVYRSLDPTHSFAVWGKNAKEYVKYHHKGLTMGKFSPLYFLEKEGGKIVLIDTFTANTFHHVVEMTNDVPCLGKRTESFPVKLPSGEIVKVRTWSFREKGCKITDGGVYLDYMRKNKLLKEGKIGNADVLIIEMKKCREVIELFLKGKIRGFAGCKRCNIKPKITFFTVESDWDEEKQKVKEDTDAYIADYNPISFYEIQKGKKM